MAIAEQPARSRLPVVCEWCTQPGVAVWTEAGCVVVHDGAVVRTCGAPKQRRRTP